MVGSEARFSCQIIFWHSSLYRTYDVPEEPWQVPAAADFPAMGEDIWKLALPLDVMPDWENQSKGNPDVMFLNKLKTKHPSVNRGVVNVFPAFHARRHIDARQRLSEKA